MSDLELTMMRRVGELNKEVAALKAEVEWLTLASQGAVKYVDHTMALTRQSMEHHKQVSRLKAEVERLTAFTTRTIVPNEDLQAQVERLTKAGDAMASSIQFNEEMAKDYDGPTIVHQSVQRWNAAKEGKGQP